jgi:hypothetical protein
MTIPVSVRGDAIAERFHIDCHKFCILLESGPERCIPWRASMLCSRKQLALANWCALTDHSIDAVGDLLGLSPRSDTGVQFPAMTLDFLRIPKQGIALSAC